MRERYSPAVRRALQTALARAGAPGAPVGQTSLPVEVSAEGPLSAGASADRNVCPTVAGRLLLLALVEEEDGRAARLLEKHGLPRPDVLRQLAAAGDDGPPLALDPLLADARAVSREHDAEGTVTSDFLLLALLRTDAALGDVLTVGGLDRLALERDILGDAPPTLRVDEALQLADEPERFAAARILDVNANRAREALRVLDDFCRFVRDDAFLTEEFKRLRHDLSGLLDSLPPRWLIGSRETVRDVGTAISTAEEMTRASTGEVARVNLKRLQEALRSLEEFGKMAPAHMSFAEGIEQLRYRSYTLEKALALADADFVAGHALAEARLYVLLTGAQCAAALDWTIAEAAAGGAGIFQLREKSLDDRQLLERARRVRQWTRQAGALFIVNDRPDIARLSEADGVHLGQDDMPVHEARRILGPAALIGVSTHNLAQVRQAVLDGAGYIGVGPAFASSTKEFAEPAGLDFVKSAVAETALPAFAIGGIGLQTIDAAAAAGARRVAVSAAIAQADEPRRVAQTICEALRRDSASPGERP